MAQRGRPFVVGNKFGRGRPRGSRNKYSILAQELLSSRAEPIAAKVAAMALQGDPTAMRLAMERIVPVRRETTVNLGPLPIKTAADVSKALEKLLERVAAGKLTIAEAQGVGELLEKRRRAIETEDMDQRLRALECKYEKS
jgi:hypothetical protein